MPEIFRHSELPARFMTASTNQSILNRLFDLQARQSTVVQELRGAFATFLTMSYILFLNPQILAGAGVPIASATTCTALAAGLCCLLMGLYANFPIALASGMGLNALVAFQITVQTGSWQQAMGLVILDGIIVFILVLAGIREAMLRAIPLNLRRAIAAGIGLFIAFIGLANAKLSISTGFPAPLVKAGTIGTPETLLAAIGTLITAFLLARQIRGAIILGILICTALAYPLGVGNSPTWTPPDFSIIGQADVLGVLTLQAIPLLLTLLMVDFFDTLGTVTALTDQAKLHDEQGNPPKLKRVLLVDATGAMIGGACGVSSVTSYIESAAGVSEGARTGLSSVFVGLMFLLLIPLASLATIVPTAATAPALILVGFLMCEQITRIDFDERETAIAAFVTLIGIPLCWSITHGIGYGFITFVAIKLLSLKPKEVHPLMYAASALFIVYFIVE